MSEQQELPLAPRATPPEPAETAMLAAAAPAAPGDAVLAAIGDGPLRRLVQENFLRYASYVIRDRAIPDLEDGLKPVQRRLLFSLHEKDDGKFIKVANIVGYTMQYHPHGDASIGEALVVLVNKRLLVEGQGNFGNVLTGDPAAAARYIECRLTELARTELFQDELTAFVPTYDGRRREPVRLPVKVPLLLMLGAEGIAVGIATRILPHNFVELLAAQIAILQGKPFQVYPDFPQGGLMDPADYAEGQGHVQVRARIEPKDPQTLVIRELPFGVTTEAVIDSIEEAARKNKIRIRNISDFTAGAVEIEIHLAPEQAADHAVEALYAFTQCQVQIPSRIVVLRENRPVTLTVPEILRYNTERLVVLLRDELQLAQRQLAEDLHRKTLVRVFVERRLYQALETCGASTGLAQTVLESLHPFRAELVREATAEDAALLLEIPIRRISQFDLEQNRRELEQLRMAASQVSKHLAELVPYAIRYLRSLLKKHAAGSPRRTTITSFGAIAVRDLTATELQLGYDREKGYFGSKVAGERMRECSSYDKLLLVWSDGRYKALTPPEKLFVDATLIYVGLLDRDRVLTVAYTEEGLTYVKKFAVGGTILNREYRCIPKAQAIRFLADDQPTVLYVQYVPDGRQKILQQEFPVAKVLVRDRQTGGAMLTSKKIHFIGAAKPADWDDARTGPPGTFKDFA